MSIAFRLLLISIAILPPLVIFDGRAAQSVVAILAITALAAVAITARAADVNFAAQLTRWLKLAAAVPAIWMVIQILPMPFSGLSHSIWINANEALNQQYWGHISVDLGATIEALALYLANISLIVVTVFVAGDRRRSEITLIALAVITMFTVIVLLIQTLAFTETAASSEANEVLSAISSLGLILSLTSGVRAIEGYESRRADPTRPLQIIQVASGVCGAGLLVCLVGLAISATLNGGLAAAFGVATFGAIQAIRRVGLGYWATGIFLTTIFAAAVMIILWRYGTLPALSPFLQFATGASPDAISVARRVLSDTNWLGTGAGTYLPLLLIYQDLSGLVKNAPSTALAFAIELGLPMTLLSIALAVGLIVVLFRGALIRGRDSFYPAAAAAGTIILVGQAFCDTSLLHPGVALIGDTVIGLGLAQSMSRGISP